MPRAGLSLSLETRVEPPWFAVTMLFRRLMQRMFAISHFSENFAKKELWHKGHGAKYERSIPPFRYSHIARYMNYARNRVKFVEALLFCRAILLGAPASIRPR
jgi:hypothetical protein